MAEVSSSKKRSYVDILSQPSQESPTSFKTPRLDDTEFIIQEREINGKSMSAGSVGMTTSNKLYVEPGVPLVERVHSWNTFEPEKIKEDFLYLKSSTPADLVGRLLTELEGLHDGGQIYTPHFCLFIRITSSMSTAIRILRTRVEPLILFAAVDVIRVHWQKTAHGLESVLEEANGTAGIIEILASLPTRVAKRLFQALTRRGGIKSEALARSQVVDSIIRAAFPFLNSDPNANVPLRRLAFMVLRTIIIAGSPSLLRTMIPQLEQDITAKIWKSLGLAHPKLISELVFIQLDTREESQSNKNWALGGILKIPQNLFTAILAISHRQSDAAGELGIPFLWNCLESCIRRSHPKRGDVFGMDSNLLAELEKTGLISRLLREKCKGPEGIRSALQIIDVLKAIHSAVRKEEWGWVDASPVVNFAVKRFVSQNVDWDPAMPIHTSLPPDGSPTAATILHTIFKDFRHSDFSLSSPHPSFISILDQIPTKFRFPFLATAYFARFSVDLGEENLTPPAPFATSLLYLLDHSHGQDILRRGMDGHGNAFLLNTHASHSPSSFRTLYPLFATTIPQIGAGHIREAQSALFRAAWITSDIKRFEDPLLPQMIKAIDRVKQDISSFKLLAARAQTGFERLAFLQIIFTIISRVQCLDLLNETLLWAAKRFGKDPEAGIGLWNWLLDDMLTSVLARPRPFRQEAQNDDEATIGMAALRSYFEGAGRILRTLRVFRDLLANEPGLVHQSTNMWNNYGVFLGKVISGRIDFASKLPNALVQHSGIRDALFEDLSPLILTHGHTGSYPIRPFPMQFHNTRVPVPCKLLHCIIPWIDDLGVKCEGLYLAALKAGDNLQPRPTNFWPLLVTVPTFRDYERRPQQDTRTFDITTTYYYARIEAWLFHPPSTLYAHLADTFDPYHGSHQMLRYIEDYVDFSKDQAEVTRKVERLLAQYGVRTEAGVAFRETQAWPILNSTRIQTEIKRSRHLFHPFIDKLLPPYSPDDKDPQRIIFDPSDYVPIDNTNAAPGSSITGINPTYRRNVFTSFIDGIVQPDHEIGSLPVYVMERLAVLVVAWMATSLDIQHTENVQVQGPVTYAMKYVRLDKDFMKGEYHSLFAWSYSILFLEASIKYLRASDLRQLVDIITAIPVTPFIRSIAVDLIRALRFYHTPEFVVDLSFYILADTDSSSWHRQSLSKSLLTGVRPETAGLIMNRFIQFLAARKLEQSQLENPVSKQDTAAAPQEESKVILKISTLKMFLEVLQSGIQGGVFLEDAFGYIQLMMDISTHPSVLQVIITVVVTIIRVEDMLDGYGPTSKVKKDGAWAILRSFSQQGTRLSETVSITDEVWGDVRRGDAPMPTVETSHPIATTFFNTSLAGISPAARERWTKDILVPLISGQIHNRTLWLRAAFLREGGTGEEVDLIQATYDSTFDAATCLKQILNLPTHLPDPSCINELLPFVEQRLRTPFSRHLFEMLRDLTQESYKGRDEEFKMYLANVRLLTHHALSNDSLFFNAALGAIVHAINSDTLPSDSRRRFVAVIERLGESLLSPEHMLLSHDLQKKSPPFTLFLSVLCTLYPSMHSPANPKWHERIKPIVEGLLSTAIRLEHAQSNNFLHGGACYWPVIISLKVSLLPHPSVEPYALTLNRVGAYGAALVGLAHEVLSFPSHRLLFSSYFLDTITSHLRCAFADVIPLCKVLTSDEAVTNNGEARVACFQIALELIRSFSTQFETSVMERTSRDEMVETWSEDTDGVVRWMARNLGYAYGMPSRATYSTSSGRGRGRGRGGRLSY